MASECSSCEKKISWLDTEQTIHGKTFCESCANKYLVNALSSVMLTTTNNIDGFIVEKYIDIECVEVVIGTGVFSEIDGSIADFFGGRSTEFEVKLQKGKELAFKKLKLNAYEKGANAVIGIDIDYTEFSRNRIGVVANGTSVNIEARITHGH